MRARAACAFAACALLLLPRAAAPLQAQRLPAELRTQVTLGHGEAALALLQALPITDQQSSEARYLAARLHEDAGRLQEALASLPTELSQLPQRVARDIEVRRGLLLSRTGQCAQARPILTPLASEPDADAEVTQHAGECALLAGDASAALSLLSGKAGRAPRSFAALLSLARAQEKTGDRNAAVRTLRELYLKRPGHPRNAEAAKRLSALGQPVQLSDAERLQRAALLLDSNRSEAVLAELAQLKAPKAKGHRASVLHLRGMALFRMRTRYAEAARVLAAAAALRSPTQDSDAYHAARALARADRDAQAVKALRAFAKRHPRSRYAHEAVHDAAWLELRHNLPGGVANMRAVLAAAEKRGDSARTASALWHLAFHGFSRGRYAQVVPLFLRYAKTSPQAMVSARGAYWAGRAAQLAGARATALTHYRSALAIEPLHWYALLSSARLRELGEDPGPAFAPGPPLLPPVLGDSSPPPPPLLARLDSAPEVTPEVTPESTSESTPVLAPLLQAPPAAPKPAIPEPLPLPEDAAFYARLGLMRDAVQSVREQEAELRKAAGADAALLALVRTYFTLGEYARPYRLVAREHSGTLHAEPTGEARWYWDALFPRPYTKAVTHAAARERLPDDFVYAIMRKESAFDPHVVSHADAIGLLQLLERTGRAMARSSQHPGFTRQSLFEPDTNVNLGAHYLRTLLTRYDGQFVPAIAAYNAGEHRIDAWLTRATAKRPRIDVDRFVEEIPIEQTHNYVRRVVANWARYRLLTGEPDAAELPVPLTLTR